MMQVLMIFQFLLCSLIWFVFTSANSKPTTSQDFLMKHINSALFVNALDSRCQMAEISAEYISHRKHNTSLCFVHIPKAGGTEVRNIFSTHKVGKLSYMGHFGHDPFILREIGVEGSKCVFFTLFRDPVDRLISFYNYVNSKGTIPATQKDNQAWLLTYKVKPHKWVETEYIRNFAYDHTLKFFLVDYSSVSEATKQWEPWKNVQKLRNAKYEYFPWVKFNTTSTLYTQSIPRNYQCLDHLRVLKVLLERFTFVGTLPQVEETLQRVSYAINGKLLPVGKKHSNSSIKALEESEKKLIRDSLEDFLFCDYMLYEMVRLIAERDEMVKSNKSRVCPDTKYPPLTFPNRRPREAFSMAMFGMVDEVPRGSKAKMSSSRSSKKSAPVYRKYDLVVSAPHTPHYAQSRSSSVSVSKVLERHESRIGQ